MSILGQGANTRISINGTDVVGVEDGREIQVLISFENGAVQGNATAESLTFVRDARQLLKAHIASGLTGGVGIFEGVPMTLSAYNINQEISTFEGYIDLSQAEIDDSNSRLTAPIVKSDGLQSLDARLSAITFGLLESEGAITDADYIDIDYVVQKSNNAFESLVSSIMLFLMFKELAEKIKDTSKDIATATGIASGALTGGIGAAVFAFLAVGIDIVYTVAILSAIIKLGRDLISAFAPPVRTHKAITFRRALERVCLRLDYTFQSSLPLLNNYTYLPSNMSADEFDSQAFLKKAGTIKKGIPKANDYGYNCNEFFALVAKLFNVRYTVVGATVVAETEYAPYWLRQSSYVMPSMLAPKYSFNSDKVTANRSFNFSTDLKDEYTITNYKGTSYQVTIKPISIGNAKNVVLKDFIDIDFNLALATRKDELTGIDKVLLAIAKALDGAIKVFGGRSNLAGQIRGTVGIMKVSDNYHSLPKVLYIDSGRIPANHRDLLSAKAIYEAYYYPESPANATFFGQKLLYSGVDIPFSFNDFVKVLNNSYFYDNQGRAAKFLSLLWNSTTGRATADYEVQEVYTKNLQEVYNEQE